MAYSIILDGVDGGQTDIFWREITDFWRANAEELVTTRDPRHEVTSMDWVNSSRIELLKYCITSAPHTDCIEP
jgi:hypothetical protein